MKIKSRPLVLFSFPTLVFILSLQLPHVHALPQPLTLDGVGVSTCRGQFCAHSQLLNTTQEEDVILVTVETCCGTNVTSITDTMNLTFYQRVMFTSNTQSFTTNFQTLWEYYAVAPLPLIRDNITANVTPMPSRYKVWGVQVVAVHGANPRNIFDRNPSIPSTMSCPSQNCGDCLASYQSPGICSSSIQTSTIDFVIAITAIDGAGPCNGGYPLGRVPGFTGLTFQNNRFEVDYTITTIPHSKVVFSCSGTDGVGIVLDAIAFSGAFDA